MTELIFESETGHRLLLDRESEAATVEVGNSASMVIDLKSGCVRVLSSGDMSFIAGGTISLDGAQGVDIRSGGELRLSASEDNVIRGKVVRIN
jgi:hypothetical protein